MHKHSPRFFAKATAVAIAATSMLALSACGSTDESSANAPAKAAAFRTLAEIKDAGSIKLGVFYDKSPFGSQDADGNFVGYDVDYGQRIGEDLGVDVEWVPVEAASRVAFLETGKVDAILANFTVTEERAEKVDFANPYLKVSLGVASPTSTPITDVAQLADKTAIVVKGTTAETYLQDNHPEIKLQKYEQYTEATSALLDGRGDAWVTDNTESLAWTLQNPTFTTSITTLGPTDTIAAAVTKGNDTLREWLNDELVDLGEEDFFHADYEKNLLPVYGDAVSPEELVVEGGKL